MLYLSPILLCISLNILLLTVTSSLKTQKISLNKSTIISISVFLTLITFISMEFGKFINLYLLKYYSNRFGGVLLSFIGIYYLVEHRKKVEYRNGYDTSFYYETFPKYRRYFFSPKLIDNNNSKCIEINESLYISLPLSLCTLYMFFAAGITLVNIPFTLFLMFVSTSCILCINYFNKSYALNNFLNENCLLIVSIILIADGILEILI